MNDPIEHRVTRLEFRVDAHDEDLTTIKGDSKTMSETLKAIQDNLKQIKWLAVGALIAFLIQKVGLVDTIKLFL